MGASPIVGPADQTQMLQQLDDRLKVIEQTAIIPVGIVAFCAGAVPNGWLAMDGSALDAARYGQLSNYLNGAANLPDAAGRVLVGQDAGTFATLLGTGGVETVQLTSSQSGLVAHNHAGGTTSGETGHTHTFPPGSTAYASLGTAPNNWVGTNPGFGSSTATGASSGHTHTTPTVANSIAATASAAHTNLQPYLVLIPIIKF